MEQYGTDWKTLWPIQLIDKQGVTGSSPVSPILTSTYDTRDHLPDRQGFINPA